MTQPHRYFRLHTRTRLGPRKVWQNQRPPVIQSGIVDGQRVVMWGLKYPMPTITQLAFDPKAISLSLERDAKRSPGIHLSSIIKDMLVTAGVKRNVKGKPFSAEEQHMLFQQGFLWERLVAEYIASDENQLIEWDNWVTKGLNQISSDAIAKSDGALVRPGECCMDGIYMTPDAANLKYWFVEEWKATSIRPYNFHPAERKPEWLWQVAAYARFYGMTRGTIRVWHYSAMPAAVTQWFIEWTKEEIESNWANVIHHWNYMQERDKKV